MGNALAYKQAQLITIHSKTQTTVVQSKDWLSLGCYLTKYPCVSEYRIPLHANDVLDSLDDLALTSKVRYKTYKLILKVSLEI